MKTDATREITIIRYKNVPWEYPKHVSTEDISKAGAQKKSMLSDEQITQGEIKMLYLGKIRPGGSSIRHYHEDMTETYTVLEGEITFSIDDAVFILNQYDMIIIPTLCQHQFSNKSENMEAKYLVLGVSTGENGKTIVV